MNNLQTSNEKRTCGRNFLGLAISCLLALGLLYVRRAAMGPPKTHLRPATNESLENCAFTDYVSLELEKFEMFRKFRQQNTTVWCLPRSSDGNLSRLSLEKDFQLAYEIIVDIDQLATNGKRHFGCALVRIRETVAVNGKGEPYFTFTSGGSELYLLVHENDGRRYTCLVRDHFDGNYTGYCPLYGGCFNLTVTLQHHGFIGYCTNAPRMSKRVVWRGRICPSDIPIFDRAPFDHDSTAYIGWWTDPNSNSTWPEETWKGRAGQWSSRLEEGKLKDCLQGRIRSLTVIGDSHMTYLRTYFLSLIGKLTPALGKSHKGDWERLGPKFRQVDKTWYYPTDFTFALFRPLDEHFAYLNRTNVTLTENDVIIFDGGAYDMFSGGAELYATRVANLALFVERLRRNARTREAIVALFTIPPANGAHKSIMPYNSNAQVAACNALALRELRSQVAANPHNYESVLVVDYYVLLMAHYEKVVDDHHFVMVDRRGENVLGEVGKQATSEGFRQICELLR